MISIRCLGAVALVLTGGCAGQPSERTNARLETDYGDRLAQEDSVTTEGRANLMKLLEADTAEANAVLAKLGHYRDVQCLNGDSLVTATTRAVESDAAEGVDADSDRIGLDCGTTHLASIESRDEFQDAVGDYLEAFDSALNDLERSVLDSDELSDRFDGVIELLIHARNEVAVRVAETANSSAEAYPETKAELMSAVSRFDILLDVATSAVNDARSGSGPNVF